MTVGFARRRRQRGGDAVAKKLSTMSLEFRLSHRWLMGLKQTSYVGFIIKNKMADLNTCTYLGFSIKNKIRMSEGYPREKYSGLHPKQGYRTILVPT